MSTITIDGVAVPAMEGEALGAVLVRAGHMDQRIGRTGRKHGYFCGMGICFECVVEIDGLPGQRACSTKVRDGMTVRRQPHLADVTGRLAQQRLGPDRQTVETPDVLVIGAGPAGLEAALAARTCGADVLLVDERAVAGGQFYKQALPSAGHPAPAALDGQMEEGRRLIRSVLDSGVRYRPGTTAWFASRLEDGGTEIGLLTEGVATVARPRCLIVATGATERPYPVSGWTLPGVMTCGGMQTLVRSSAVAPAGRIVVAGNGPLNLQLACELIDAKADVVAVVESAAIGLPHLLRAASAAAVAPRLMARGARMLLKLRRHGVRIFPGHAVRSIEGGGAVDAVTIAPVGADGSFAPQGLIRLDADAVALGYGFLPENGIARLLGLEMGWNGSDLGSATVVRDDDLATSMRGVYVVGEAGAFGGANVAMAEGRIAGAAAARACGYAKVGAGAMSGGHRSLARHRRFQRALWGLFGTGLSPLAGMTPDTVVCRCEDVTAGQIRAAAGEVGNAIGAVKRVTRAGMGRCQGRFCGPVVRHMLSDRSAGSETDLAAPQNPIKPVGIAQLAREKGEWGGHKRVPLPPPTKRSGPAAAGAPDRIRCDALVIGGGIVGCCTARALALAGLDVVLTEAGEVNGQASGSNAGSLHVQLLSFDLGEKAESGGGPALRTLPLQKASVDLWERLAGEIGDDIGFARRGGLMVADDESQMRFLERKAELERSMGVASTVVGAREARAILPALSDHVAGALWCPEEGKVNPLLATPLIARLAAEAGARIFTNSRVEAIGEDSRGWSARTSRMEVSARYVVNAAGPWASDIGKLAGSAIPVFAAPLQMIVTEPIRPLVDVLLSHADRHLTLKQSENGNVIIGGGWHAGLSPTHRHPRPTRESIEGNLWVAQHVLPDLRGLNIIRSWSAININIDGAPILGEIPGKRGLFTAVMSGGYTLGPIAGRITADMITRGKSEFDLSAFAIERFGRTG